MNNTHTPEDQPEPDLLHYPRTADGAPEFTAFTNPAEVAGLLLAMDSYTGAATRAPYWVSGATLLKAYRAMPKHARGGAWNHLSACADRMGETDPAVYNPLRDAFINAVPYLRTERVLDINERQAKILFDGIVRTSWLPNAEAPAAENQT